MRLTIEHVFEGIAVADYERLFFDEAFNDALGNQLKLGRHLVRLDRSENRVVRHVCYEPAREAGHAPEAGTDAERGRQMARAFDQAYGSNRASFVEELDYELATHRGTWRTIPNRWAERVRNAGTIELAAAPGGTRRTVHAEISVRAFGFGGIVERMVAAEIEKNYEATTAFTRAWLARAPH